jgi:predicted transcriptional regulator of viral defense system
MKSTPVQTQEKAVLQLARKQVLLRASHLSEHGVPTIALTRLVKAGKLERIARGLYCLPNAAASGRRSLAEISIRLPRGVICLLSALRVHEIGTQAPFEVWLAIPQRMMTPKIRGQQVRIVRMSGRALSEGVQHIKADGVQIPVFTAAKTVADCFKYRNKIGLDVALEALRESWRARKVTMDQLWHFAAVNRVTNVMRPYLEALVA